VVFAILMICYIARHRNVVRKLSADEHEPERKPTDLSHFALTWDSRQGISPFRQGRRISGVPAPDSRGSLDWSCRGVDSVCYGDWFPIVHCQMNHRDASKRISNLSLKRQYSLRSECCFEDPRIRSKSDHDRRSCNTLMLVGILPVSFDCRSLHSTF
jgi:hypothetical protein